MTDLATIAPAFVDMAHRIVWCTVATVGPDEQPRTRILHPFWTWDGASLVGVLATGPTPLKRAHLAHSPLVSLTYWDPTHDNCTADCTAEWIDDDAGREELWRTLADAPEPVGYDPAIIPAWADGPLTPAFAGLRLTPHRLRVMPGTVMTEGRAELLLNWSAAGA
jgi:hypothetical protein